MKRERKALIYFIDSFGRFHYVVYVFVYVYIDYATRVPAHKHVGTVCCLLPS